MQIGLIAGAGELPEIIGRDARQRGYRVICIALENLASPGIDGVSDHVRWINVGKFGDIVNTLKEQGITEVVMAGKVPKSLLYKSKITPDLRAMKLLLSLRDRSDDALLRAIAKELEKDGIRLLDTATFSAHLLTREGVLTSRHPTKEEWKDIEYGWHIAKEIGKLDIGQTVVVKERTVMAVEAIEGTDEAILRGGKWAGEGCVVVKVSKPQQDMRLDVPAVGPATLASMTAAKAKVLALEAQRSLIIEREQFVREAEGEGISVVGLRRAIH